MVKKIRNISLVLLTLCMNITLIQAFYTGGRLSSKDDIVNCKLRLRAVEEDNGKPASFEMIHKYTAALQVAPPKNPLQYKGNKNIMKEIEEFINDPDADKCGTPGHFIKMLEFLENECPKTTNAQKQHYCTIVLKILSITNDSLEILLKNSFILKKRVKNIVASQNEIHKEFEGCLVELFELGNCAWRSRSLILSKEPKWIKLVLKNLIDVCDQISNMPQSIITNNSSYFDATYRPKLQSGAAQYTKQLIRLKNIEYL